MNDIQRPSKDQLSDVDLSALIRAYNAGGITHGFVPEVYRCLVELQALRRSSPLLDGLSIQQWKEHAKAGWRMYAARAENEPPPASKDQLNQAFDRAVNLLGEMFAWKRRQQDDGEYYVLKFSGDSFFKVNVAMANLGVAIRDYSSVEPGSGVAVNPVSSPIGAVLDGSSLADERHLIGGARENPQSLVPNDGGICAKSTRTSRGRVAHNHVAAVDEARLVEQVVDVHGDINRPTCTSEPPAPARSELELAALHYVKIAQTPGLSRYITENGRYPDSGGPWAELVNAVRAAATKESEHG